MKRFFKLTAEVKENGTLGLHQQSKAVGHDLAIAILKEAIKQLKKERKKARKADEAASKELLSLLEEISENQGSLKEEKKQSGKEEETIN